MKITILKRIIFGGLVFMPSLLISPSAAAQSLSQSDLSSIYSDTVWYQAGGSTACAASGGTTSLNGSDPDEEAYNFFVAQGLTPEQSAGIVGNFKWESGVDPTKDGGGGDSTTPTDTWGIAQWTEASGRLGNLENYAQQNNVSIDLLSTQLAFSWYELNSGTQQNTLSYLVQVTGTGIPAVDSSSNIIYNNYEAPGKGDTTGPKRAELAEQVYNEFVGSTVSQSGSGGCTSSVGSGQNTQYINNFAVYDQCDPQWRNDPYGSGGTDRSCDNLAGPNTIGANGCGPSAMAMIITALTGSSVTPDVTAAYADAQGLYEPGVGSSWSIASNLADHWGLKATYIGADVASINNALQSGALVITAGEGPPPFTTGGHFIVIRGIASDGKWEIGDSGHSDTSSQEWSPQQLVASMNDGSVYAISK